MNSVEQKRIIAIIAVLLIVLFVISVARKAVVPEENLTEEQVFQKTISKNTIKREEVEKWYIQRKSIDARKKEDIYYNYSIDLKLKDKKKENKFEKVEEYNFPEIKVKNKFE